MRLVAVFAHEEDAFKFTAFLKNELIACSYELGPKSPAGEKYYHVWVMSEDDVSKALEWVGKFRHNPQDPLFLVKGAGTGFVHKEKQAEPVNEAKIETQFKTHSRFLLTNFLIALCILLFFWNAREIGEMERLHGRLAHQIELTDIEQTLFFDYPQSIEELQRLLSTVSLKEYKEVQDLPPNIKKMFARAEQIPSWKGMIDVLMHWKETGLQYLRDVPLFEKIRKGEVWRFFTPCLLHRDFFHILFNMAWLFVLGRQIEERLKKWKMLLLILIIGIVSNTIQYLISGPFFLGFSGVVVGMVGYIWMRQRKAPWEGYPLHRSIMTLVFIFVLAMLGLELVATLLASLNVTEQSPHIANTAHIVGGLIGIYLGKLSYFSKSIS